MLSQFYDHYEYELYHFVQISYEIHPNPKLSILFRHPKSPITVHLLFSPRQRRPRRSQIKIKGHGSRVSPPIHIHETESALEFYLNLNMGWFAQQINFPTRIYWKGVSRSLYTPFELGVYKPSLPSILSRPAFGYPLRSASKQEEYSRVFEAHACVLFVSDDVAIISLPP